MAFSISNLFNGTPAAQPAAPATPAPTPATPGNMPDNPVVTSKTTEGTAPNGVVPADGNMNSSLDQFKDLWQPTPTDPNAPVAPTALDPTKVAEAVSKANFSNVISQESLQAIAAGGDAAVKAFQDSMNAVAQQAVTQSILVANQMTEKAVQTALQKQQKDLPDMIRKQSLNENLTSANPLFKNPAVKPILDAVQHQLAGKYPNATATELATMAQNFVTVLGENLVPKKETPKGSDDSVDWELFLNGQG